MTGKGNENMAESLIRASDGLHNVCSLQICMWGFTHWSLNMQAYTCLSVCEDTSYRIDFATSLLFLLLLFGLSCYSQTWQRHLHEALRRSGVWQEPKILDIFSPWVGCGQNFHRCWLWSFPQGRGYFSSFSLSLSRQDYWGNGQSFFPQ